jgi:hypothetical protein
LRPRAEGGGAPGGEGGAVEDAQAPAVDRFHDHDFALEGRQSGRGVGRVDGSQLGHGDFFVRGGHDQEDTAAGQGEVQAFGGRGAALALGGEDGGQGLGQGRIGQAQGGVGRADDVHGGSYMKIVARMTIMSSEGRRLPIWM